MDDYGASVGNDAYRTAGVLEKNFRKIKKSEADTDFDATYNIFFEEDTVNDKTHDSSEGVNL